MMRKDKLLPRHYRVKLRNRRVHVMRLKEGDWVLTFTKLITDHADRRHKLRPQTTRLKLSAEAFGAMLYCIFLIYHDDIEEENNDAKE